MFKGMRRFKQSLSVAEAENILLEGKTGVLAINGDNGYPYAVPLNYVYFNDKIYIHSAKKGYKIDCILRNSLCSFTVTTIDTVVPETLTTHYKSVIIFGQAKIITDLDLNRPLLYALTKKYAPNYIEALHKEIERGLNDVSMIEISIDHISAKAAIELISKNIQKEE